MLTKLFTSKQLAILSKYPPSSLLKIAPLLNYKPLFSFSHLKNLPKDKKQTVAPDAQSKKPIDPAANPEEEEKENEDSSFFNEGKTSLYIFVVASLGLVGAYGMMQIYTIIYNKETNKKNVKVKYSGAATIGGPWKLINTEGNVMTNKDLKGSYYLIYFGFCNCPDICPLTLQKISKAMNVIEKTAESRYFKLKCLFVSVDPDRDSLEKIKRF